MNSAQPTKSPEYIKAWGMVRLWCPLWVCDSIHEAICEDVAYGAMKALLKVPISKQAVKSIESLMVFY